MLEKRVLTGKPGDPGSPVGPFNVGRVSTMLVTKSFEHSHACKRRFQCSICFTANVFRNV